MKNCYLIVLLLLLAVPLSAQTSLGPGDVMFTLVNTDNTDAFAFVLLKDVTAGTSFRVTKGEYKSGTLQTSDGTTEITFTTASSCGAEFLFTSQVSGNGSSTGFYNPTSLNGGGSVTSTLVDGTSMTLASSGDGLIAFQGGTYITIIQKCGHEFGFDDSQCSDLPPGLTSGMNAFFLNNPSFPTGNSQREPDNVKYNCSTTSGTPAQIAAAISTPSRWDQNNDNTFSYGSGCGFTCLAACADPVLNSLSLSNNSPCPGANVNINISGSLNDASRWDLRQGGCNGALITSTTSSSFTVSVSEPTQFSVTTQDCNNNRTCRSVTITPAINAAEAGPDQLLTTYPATLNGSAPGTGSGAWSEVSGDGNGSFGNASSPSSTFTGTAGVGYTLRWTVSGAGCPATTDAVQVSSTVGNTTLAAGDIMFTMINSDAEDEFAFVVLTDMVAGTSFSITDKEYRNGSLTSDEGILTILVQANTTCGSEFVLSSPDNNGIFSAQRVSGTGNVAANNASGSILINTSGDGLIAYQGSNYLTALQKCGFAFGNLDSQCSELPPGLTEGVNALAYTNSLSGDLAEPDNIKYDCSPNSSPAAGLAVALSDVANWLEDNTTPFDYGAGCNFNCQTCDAPVINSISLSNTAPCINDPVTLTIMGDLMGANNWVVYGPGDCGGARLGQSTGGNTITFAPTESGNFLVAGADGCVVTPACNNVIINTVGQQAVLSEEIFLGNANAAAVNVSGNFPTNGVTAALTFSDNTDGQGVITGSNGVYIVSGTSGVSYQVVYTLSQNGCTTTDEATVILTRPTDLSIGDIAFTGLNTDGPDGFSFVAFGDIGAGTEITFTDRGWNGGFIVGTETTFTLLLNQSLACGDQVYLEAGQFDNTIADWTASIVNDGSPAGIITAVDGAVDFAFGTSGDQVFAYQGAEPTGETAAGNADNFLAAITTNCSGGLCTSDWDNQITSQTQDSDLPTIFNAGEFSTILSPTGSTAEVDNGQYDCGLGGTTPVLANVVNPANWNTNTTGGFDLSLGCLACDPLPMAMCRNTSVQIDANGNPTFNGQPFQASDLDGGSTDNGSIDPNGFSVDITPGCANVNFPPAPTIVTLTVKDNLGQTATCTSEVLVQDAIAPVITCQNIAVDLGANGTASLNTNAVADAVLTSFTDNCASNYVSLGFTVGQIGCADVGVVNLTIFYRDRPLGENSQEASCTVEVQVNDPTLACDDDPVAMCNPIAIVQVNANGDLDLSSINNGSTDDNTAPGDFILSIDGDILDCADVDMPAQTVTLVVTDNVGQTATCTSEVTVEDNVAPTGTCQNVVYDLDGNGMFNPGGFSGFALGDILTSFQDNCATGPNSNVGGSQFIFGCADIGINSELYGFYDRSAFSANRQEFVCTPLIQINDPLGVCGSAPIVNCQDFAAGPDPGGSYTLDANSLDNGSTDDRSVYSLAFSNATSTIGQTADNVGNNNSVGHGQSFTATQTGAIQKIKVRFATARSNATLYLYNSATGSGVSGSIGTPAYTQTGIELFASPTGALTEILLDAPFPVVSGQQYSFVFDGFTDPYFGGTSASYPDGDFIFNYDLSSGCCTFGDLVFEIDFIGPTTQEFNGDGDYPVTVYAVDDQGNVSGACMTTFTLDATLPVEWLSFGANAGAKTVDLQWETSYEPDNAGFHIERSATGNDWVAIGEVPSRTGTNQRYDYTDSAPLGGTSYYRLRQTDFDGQVSYSPVETVEFYGGVRVVISPNPATNTVSVQLPEGAELLGLLDVTGRMTRARFDGDSGQLRTDVSGLPAGVYFLRVRLANGELSARRLMVR